MGQEARCCGLKARLPAPRILRFRSAARPVAKFSTFFVSTTAVGKRARRRHRDSTHNSSRRVPASPGRQEQRPQCPDRPVRVRARRFHGDRRRALRTKAGLRPRRRARGCRAPRAVRGHWRGDPRRALPALGQDPAAVRPGQSQAGLLPLDGVSHRPVAGEQHHQSHAVARGRRRCAGRKG